MHSDQIAFMEYKLLGENKRLTYDITDDSKTRMMKNEHF